ncbi:DUF2924 domain-containing protein [Candidatus Nitrospira neomarina]|uniref:DUF2924 domain-containing protein n=1 Tax=Candidatus Nitrospira neomarina TaxID=3020899 RepID=A0AA96GMU2_9BACT|nr:DUF2924 domain-containing protein [Candidatus Nitrospira neomarina]WNM63155.1 DUF2924 domain-containing protein [Candidatus Nitrospira neomarina]
MNPQEPPGLSALRHMTTSTLVREWTQTFGGPPSLTTGREFLLYTLAWQRQAEQHGGLSLMTQRQLKATRTVGHAGRSGQKGAAPRPAPGTVLFKTWQGQRYTITVDATGYQFQGQPYASLSEIARRITGTRWNGPAFFGLRRTKPQNESKESD